MGVAGALKLGRLGLGWAGLGLLCGLLGGLGCEASLGQVRQAWPAVPTRIADDPESFKGRRTFRFFSKCCLTHSLLSRHFDSCHLNTRLPGEGMCIYIYISLWLSTHQQHAPLIELSYSWFHLSCPMDSALAPCWCQGISLQAEEQPTNARLSFGPWTLGMSFKSSCQAALS